MINLALHGAGARLVSCSESIDETPSGVLLHGIIATIAEFYSRNLGTEALRGMTEKAKRGGTNGKAAIGYLNVGKLVDGREVRTVELDPDRSPWRGRSRRTRRDSGLWRTFETNSPVGDLQACQLGSASLSRYNCLASTACSATGSTWARSFSRALSTTGRIRRLRNLSRPLRQKLKISFVCRSRLWAC
jgi:hypothetical protein